MDDLITLPVVEAPSDPCFFGDELFRTTWTRTAGEPDEFQEVIAVESDTRPVFSSRLRASPAHAYGSTRTPSRPRDRSISGST